MIEYQNGTHLIGTELWFDAKKKVPLSFISSADTDKFTPPEKILATPETIKFLEKRIKKPVVLPCPYYRPFALGNLQVELVPSGTMLGAAQMIIDKGNKTLLYSGDINLKLLPTTDPAYTKHCDVLVLKCPFGTSDYKFPSLDKSMELLVKFANDALSNGQTPVLLTDPLGVAQDLMKELTEMELKLSVHKTIHKFTKVYEELGIKFGNYELFTPSQYEEKVVLFPHDELFSKDIQAIKQKRTCYISEFTTEEKPMFKSELNVDELINFSNRADYDDLLEFVDLVKPEKVYLIEDNANQFAHVLEQKGYEVISFEKPTQLDLL